LEGVPWFALRVEGDLRSLQALLLKSLLARQKSGSQSDGGLRLATGAERVGIAKEAVYAFSSGYSALHVIAIPLKQAWIFLIADDAGTVKRIQNEVLTAKGKFRDYFRPDGVEEAAGLGFVSAALAGALGATDSYIAPAALKRMRALQASSPAAPIIYRVQNALDGSASARLSIVFPNRFVETTLRSLAIGLDEYE